MIKKIIGSQIINARDREIVKKILEDALKQNKILSKRIREFHRNFTKILADNMEDKFKHGDNMSRWHMIFKEDLGENVSYYRKDSYLLADAPFVFKPVISPLKPNKDEYSSYYGVNLKGVKSLIENHVVWPEVYHISYYHDNEKVVEELCEQIIPYYMDAFEDSMAIYWIDNIMDGSKVSLDIKNKTKDYMNNPNKNSFKFFINEIYLPYTLKQNPKLSRLIDKIPTTKHPGAPPLDYPNLRDAVVERLMKVFLLSDCLFKITRDHYIDRDNIINELEKKIDNPVQIGEYIYKFWHRYGTFWSYSEGNTVDFSARDIFPTGVTENVKPGEKIDSFSIPVPKKFENLVCNTDIDDKCSIMQQSGEREKLLKTFFSNTKNAGRINEYWMLVYREMLNKKENIEDVREDIESVFKTKIVSKKDIALAAIEIPVGIIIEVFSPIKGLGLILIAARGAYLIKNILGAQVTYIGDDRPIFPFKRIPIASTDTNVKKIFYNWRMHLISLPYKRSKSPEFENAYVPSMANSERLMKHES